jgi:hypothetical protein
MTNHPIASSFVIAVVLSIALAIVLPYSRQEAPWALLVVAMAFPFIWFLAWIVIGTIAWWRDAWGLQRPERVLQMTSETAEPDNWSAVGTYPDAIAAEADAGYLRSEGVAARVDVIRDIPGQDHGARLMVDASLAHRARWLLQLGAPSEAELEYLATGRLEPAAADAPLAPRKRSFLVIALAAVLAIVVAILTVFGTVAV